MKRFVFVVIFILMFLCFNQGFADNNIDICSCKSSDVDKDTILRCLVGHMRMYPEDIEGAKQAVICAIEQWKRRDGAIGFAISNAFLAMMNENPTIFFNIMATNGAVFSEWLDKLEPLSFTWHKEPPSPLEKKRKEFVRFLSDLGPLKNKDQDALRQKLLSTLKNIKPRQID